MSKYIWIVFGCLILALYLIPAGHIYFKQAQSLPPELQYQPSAVTLKPLDYSSAHPAVLIYGYRYTGENIRNDPFPSVITGHSPGSMPSIPGARIRTFTAEHRDWYDWILNVVYFPMIIAAGGGPILGGISSLALLAIAIPYLYKRYKFSGILLSILLVIVLTAITYGLAVFPGYFRGVLTDKQPLIRSSVPAANYIAGGFSAPVEEDEIGSHFAVVNATSKQIDVYADGLFIDKVPAKAYRTYLYLRDISRITSIDAATGQIVDDFTFSAGGQNEGLLIYNVLAQDGIRIESAPHYE
jgi:hypothetical protein